jgi:HAD superfamily hydrolase (TIGR01509 family)
MNLGAVLLDMDGTLLDSEKVWEAALRDLASHLGGVLSEATRAAIVGTSTPDSVEILYRDIGRPGLDPKAGIVWLDNRMAELFATGVSWRPGAAELLAELHAAGVAVALVTATSRKLVEVCLDTLGRDNFHVVVCGDDVAETKPHPAPYATAAALLGVDPRCCVAIEDSPTGVASALAAGCIVIAVPCEVPLDGLGAIVVDSLIDVDVDYVRALVSNRR